MLFALTSFFFFFVFPLFKSRVCVWRPSTISRWRRDANLPHRWCAQHAAPSRLCGDQGTARLCLCDSSLTDAHHPCTAPLWPRSHQPPAIVPEISDHPYIHIHRHHDWSTSHTWSTYTWRRKFVFTSLDWWRCWKVTGFKGIPKGLVGGPTFWVLFYRVFKELLW